MTKKTLLKKPPTKKRFPKARPLGRTTEPEVTPVVEAPLEPVAGEVLPPMKRVISITVNEKNHSHIDLGGFNIVEAMIYMKNAHKFLYETLKKEMDFDDGSVQEGSTNTPS